MDGAVEKTTVRKLGRPRDADSVETRARLLAAARKCFGENGFERTTNAQIAEVAGITSAAIYHYFPSKIDLYAAVFEEVQEFIYAEIEKGIELHETLVDRFSAALDVSVRINRDDPSIAGFVVDVAYEVQHHPELFSFVEPQRQRSANLVKRLCADAFAKGEVRGDIPQEALEDLLSVLLSGLLRFSTLINNSPRHAATVEVLKTMLRSADTFAAPAVPGIGN
ncbi:MAG: TetR/AcrR family transcriptional regulator [Actinobacteria bacterium]|nr:TetR/AcrR family transcriptional regulator [Actinomycetota bacterium]NBP52924.1 TetR/AcrR family transcriptional regulator [Actinomycetota bacterium]